jgi:lauroyl/myristoyl acyltransferase
VQNQSVFEASDILRVPFWLLRKASYSYAPLSFQFRLASLRGTLDSLSPRHRTGLVQTLEAHLGETTSRRELRRIARRHLQAVRKLHFTTVWPQVHDFAGVDAIRIDGLERLDAALDRGKGAILVSTHFGFPRMLKPIMSRRRRVHLVGKPAHRPRPVGRPDPRTRRDLTRGERFADSLRFSRRRSEARWQQIAGDIEPGLNLRPALEALERNETLIILADGREGPAALHTLAVAGVEIPFAPGAVSIARSTGAPVLPAFVVDDPGHSGPASLRLVIHPPLDLQVTHDQHDDLEVNLRRFADAYEQQIRAHPHNFIWSRVHNGRFDRPKSTPQRAAAPSPGVDPQHQPNPQSRRGPKSLASS